jgi:signal transduction histidine kinase
MFVSTVISSIITIISPVSTLIIVILKYLSFDLIFLISFLIPFFETSTIFLYKLERSDKYKTEFLSNMSHEIRSPINSIIGFSELLKDVKDDQEKKEQYITIIQNSSESLTKIINDILDITKIQDGKLEINNSNFYLNSIMEELFLINKTKIKNVNITLKINIPKEDTMILSDNLRFVQIFNNLLNNAIKFTKNGFIEFGYIKKKDTIKFYVKDTGIGIKKEEQQKIFERYTQIKNIKQEKIIGYGLGLSISKELVDLMGGELKLESEYNNGSYFYFELPYNKKKKIIKNLDNQKETYNYDFTGKNILIVEDIDFNIKLLQSYLEDTNANIIIATDGNEAILKYNENKQILDIILMDIQLPEMDGTDVTKIIRTIDKETPIIAQTAYAMKDDIDTIMNYGFNDILNKPIKKDDLLKIIYMYL